MIVKKKKLTNSLTKKFPLTPEDRSKAAASFQRLKVRIATERQELKDVGMNRSDVDELPAGGSQGPSPAGEAYTCSACNRVFITEGSIGP